MELPYARPKAGGGKIIRTIIKELRTVNLKPPIDSHILIAVSGGPDSVALAHLLVHYGRRVVDPERIILFHFNHRWRGRQSSADRQWLKRLAKKWGVKFLAAQSKQLPRSTSREAEAHFLRQEAFDWACQQTGARWVFTAHHQDDQAETVLWRWMTGSRPQQSQGILPRAGRVLRPLLNIRKQDLLAYLQEESQDYRLDSSNQDLRHLRNRIRAELMPVLETLFPRSVQRLAGEARESWQIKQNCQKRIGQVKLLQSQKWQQDLHQILHSLGAGRHLRRENWMEIRKMQHGAKAAQLPAGWRLSKMKSRDRTVCKIAAENAWILEQFRFVV